MAPEDPVRRRDVLNTAAAAGGALTAASARLGAAAAVLVQAGGTGAARAGVDRADAAGAVDWAFLAVDACHVPAPLARTRKGGGRGWTAASRGRSGRRCRTATASSSR